MDAFVRYHEQSAKLWERQALLKCRFVAGDRPFGRQVEETAREFIFGRPLPERAAEEIHRLRTRMEVELGREREDRLNLRWAAAAWWTSNSPCSTFSCSTAGRGRRCGPGGR